MAAIPAPFFAKYSYKFPKSRVPVCVCVCATSPRSTAKQPSGACHAYHWFLVRTRLAFLVEERQEQRCFLVVRFCSAEQRCLSVSALKNKHRFAGRPTIRCWAFWRARAHPPRPSLAFYPTLPYRIHVAPATTNEPPTCACSILLICCDVIACAAELP